MIFPERVIEKSNAMQFKYYPSSLCTIKVVSEFEQSNEHPCNAPASGALDHTRTWAGRAVIQSGVDNIPKNSPVLIIFRRCHGGNLDYIPDVFASVKQAQFPVRKKIVFCFFKVDNIGLGELLRKLCL